MLRNILIKISNIASSDATKPPSKVFLQTLSQYKLRFSRADECKNTNHERQRRALSTPSSDYERFLPGSRRYNEDYHVQSASAKGTPRQMSRSSSCSQIEPNHFTAEEVKGSLRELKAEPKKVKMKKATKDDSIKLRNKAQVVEEPKVTRRSGEYNEFKIKKKRSPFKIKRKTKISLKKSKKRTEAEFNPQMEKDYLTRSKGTTKALTNLKSNSVGTSKIRSNAKEGAKKNFLPVLKNQTPEDQKNWSSYSAVRSMPHEKSCFNTDGARTSSGQTRYTNMKSNYPLQLYRPEMYREVTLRRINPESSNMFERNASKAHATMLNKQFTEVRGIELKDDVEQRVEEIGLSLHKQSPKHVFSINKNVPQYELKGSKPDNNNDKMIELYNVSDGMKNYDVINMSFLQPSRLEGYLEPKAFLPQMLSRVVSCKDISNKQALSRLKGNVDCIKKRKSVPSVTATSNGLKEHGKWKTSNSVMLLKKGHNNHIEVSKSASDIRVANNNFKKGEKISLKGCVSAPKIPTSMAPSPDRCTSCARSRNIFARLSHKASSPGNLRKPEGDKDQASIYEVTKERASVKVKPHIHPVKTVDASLSRKKQIADIDKNLQFHYNWYSSIPKHIKNAAPEANRGVTELYNKIKESQTNNRDHDTKTLKYVASTESALLSKSKRCKLICSDNLRAFSEPVVKRMRETESKMSNKAFPKVRSSEDVSIMKNLSKMFAPDAKANLIERKYHKSITTQEQRCQYNSDRLKESFHRTECGTTQQTNCKTSFFYFTSYKKGKNDQSCILGLEEWHDASKMNNTPLCRNFQEVTSLEGLKKLSTDAATPLCKCVSTKPKYSSTYSSSSDCGSDRYNAAVIYMRGRYPYVGNGISLRKASKFQRQADIDLFGVDSFHHSCSNAYTIKRYTRPIVKSGITAIEGVPAALCVRTLQQLPFCINALERGKQYSTKSAEIGCPSRTSSEFQNVVEVKQPTVKRELLELHLGTDKYAKGRESLINQIGKIEECTGYERKLSRIYTLSNKMSLWRGCQENFHNCGRILKRNFTLFMFKCRFDRFINTNSIMDKERVDNISCSMFIKAYRGLKRKLANTTEAKYSFSTLPLLCHKERPLRVASNSWNVHWYQLNSFFDGPTRRCYCASCVPHLKSVIPFCHPCSDAMQTAMTEPSSMTRNVSTAYALDCSGREEKLCSASKFTQQMQSLPRVPREETKRLQPQYPIFPEIGLAAGTYCFNPADNIDSNLVVNCLRKNLGVENVEDALDCNRFGKKVRRLRIFRDLVKTNPVVPCSASGGDRSGDDDNDDDCKKLSKEECCLTKNVKDEDCKEVVEEECCHTKNVVKDRREENHCVTDEEQRCVIRKEETVETKERRMYSKKDPCEEKKISECIKENPCKDVMLTVCKVSDPCEKQAKKEDSCKELLNVNLCEKKDPCQVEVIDECKERLKPVCEQPTLWQKIKNFFKARPGCPPPDEWRKRELREKAERAAKAAGLMLCDPKDLPPNFCPPNVKRADTLPKVITPQCEEPTDDECCEEHKKREKCASTTKKSTCSGRQKRPYSTKGCLVSARRCYSHRAKDKVLEISETLEHIGKESVTKELNKPYDNDEVEKESTEEHKCYENVNYNTLILAENDHKSWIDPAIVSIRSQTCTPRFLDMVFNEPQNEVIIFEQAKAYAIFQELFGKVDFHSVSNYDDTEE